ncbi:hypothetical protein [Streptomyces sp. NPDC018031]|uniref:hypothetical protein n=1 Tax=Streptomyces sp. NPDC018031 TaxID=3365033 RepID=UPI0037916DB4
MSVSASLDESSVTVEPGGEAELSVQVLNSGSTVEEFRFEVVGPCAAWTTVEPASLSLYPGASGTATLTLRPPRDPDVAPGETPLGLRVIPTSDAGGTVVPERTIDVLPFTEIAAELVPRSSHGPWRGRHKVAVDSRGNTPVTVMLAAQEGSERTRLVIDPVELVIPPGQAKFADVDIRPVHRMWRGTPVNHTFQVVVAATPVPDQIPYAPVVVDGSYEQTAILPRWLPRALMAAVLLLALLAGFWYALLRPTVRSAAREAITPEAVESAISEENKGEGETKGGEGQRGGGEKPGEPSGGASGTGGGSGGGGDSGGASGGSGGASGGNKPKPGGSSGGQQGAPGGAGAPTSARQQVSDSVGGGATTETVLKVAKGKVFELTDIVVQNPQGDAGNLTVSSQDGQLLNLALENFRDSDYHFVTPIQVPAGGEITISVSCREVGKPVKAPTPSQCSESLFVGGSMRTVEQPEDE